MKLCWISVVFLLLSVAELKGGTSASEFSCLKRNLTVTVDDILRLYLDGVEITNLTNANIHNKPDVVDLPCTTKLIAIHGRNGYATGPAGILALTADDYVLTNSSFKCSNVSQVGWEKIDFDDSAWMSAVEYGLNEEGAYLFMPGISTNAKWIWLRQDTSSRVALDVEVYCRKRTDVDECLFGQPINECDPSMGRCISLTTGYNCSCNPGYQNEGQHKCKDVDECLLGPPENMCKSSSGNCTNTPGSYKCRCYQGFTNAGDQRCEGLSNNSTLPPAATDVVLILGVLLGVSFLIIVALIVVLSIVCSRTSTSKDQDCTVEEVERPKDEVDNATYEDLEMSDVNGSNNYEPIREARPQLRK